MADAEHGDSHAQVSLRGRLCCTGHRPMPISKLNKAPLCCVQGAAQPEFAFSPPPPTSGPAATAADTPTNPIRSSMTPGDLRAVKATSRRQMAAEWVAAQTGIAVPHHSDAAFRQSLADGVTLCRLMNALRPGAVGKVGMGCHRRSGVWSGCDSGKAGTFWINIIPGWPNNRCCSYHSGYQPPLLPTPPFRPPPPAAAADPGWKPRRVRQPHGRGDPDL
jgi:hypothetical protein